jgi:hypothetical protein
MAAVITFNNGSAPSTPASGKAGIYSGNDKYLHFLNDAGYDHIELAAFFTSNQSGDFTLANSASAQSPFAAANDVITVPAATTYRFELLVQITGMGATTRTTALEFDAGSATLTSISYFGEIWTGAANTIATASGQIHAIAATAQVLNATVATAAATIRASGLVRINAAGTFIPQIKFSADPTGTLLSKKDSYFLMTPLGTNTVASVGSWA